MRQVYSLFSFRQLFSRNFVKSAVLAVMMVCIFPMLSWAENISTGTNSGNAISPGNTDCSWKIVSLSTCPKVCDDSYSGTWEATPVATTNARWINATGINSSTPSGIYFYERDIIIPSNTASFSYSFRVACDDGIDSLMVISPSIAVINIPVSPTSAYHLSNLIANTIINPIAGTWKIRVRVNFIDNIAAFLLSGFTEVTPRADNCDIIQDPGFNNVTAIGGNITLTSNPWKQGTGTPQYSPTSGYGPSGGYALMWGNQVVGESIVQQLGGSGIVQGRLYKLNFAARLRSFNMINNVRVRVIAYNTNAPHRGALPTSTATLVYETPDITSTTWQIYNSCSWIADKNYSNIEILPVNSGIGSTYNNGNYVSWCDIDTVKMCEIGNACEGLDFKIYPDQSIQGKCCYKIDLNFQNCISNLKGVRIKIPSGVTIASASAPTSWSQTGLTSSSTFWNVPPTSAPLSASGGTLCLTAPNSNPFYIMIEWTDINDSIFCRTERKLVCPPPCMEIEKLKSISCIGYNDKGYPQYSYCLDVVNNGVSQTAFVSTPSGIITPSPVTLPSGASLLCGTYTTNNTTPPSSIVITVSVNGCKDSISIKLPTDCPPRQCLELERISLKCLATSASGNTTYEYSWLLTNVSGVSPNTVTVTSSGGYETMYNNVTLASQLTGVLQNATPVNDSICLTFTLRNIEKVVVCIKTICIPAPKCQNCCDNFYKGVKVTRVRSTGLNSNGDNISMDMSFAPNRPIRSMTATIVGASRRRLAPYQSNWERIYGDIGGASAIPSPVGPGLRYYGGITPSTSFVNPTLKTREVEWGTNYAGTTGTFSTTIGLLFPIPLSGTINRPAADELDYYVRIAMTDINCVRCDTLVHVTMRRRSLLYKTVGDAKNIVKGARNPKGEQVVLGATAVDDGSPLELKMNSKDKGVLTLQLPIDNSATTEEKITVIGVGFKPEEIIDISEFTPITSNFTVVPNQDTLYCSGQLKEGQTASFNVLFNNPPFDRWENTVIIKYQIGTEPDTLTDYVTVIASVPVDSPGGDKFEDISDKTMKPRTYALSFTNANKSNRAIASVELRMPKGIKLLALGSGLGDTVTLETISTFKDDTTKIESFLVQLLKAGSQKATLKTNENVKPFYITVTGGTAGSGFDIGFTTKDEDGVVLSEGTIKLTIPLSVKNDEGDGARTGETMLLEVYPNPASNSATINLGLQNDEVLNIVVTDLLGKEISTIVSEKALPNGNHAFVLNTEMFSNGGYLITAKTRDGRTVSTQLKVVK
ncbi:MAG: T9SS type A sorting domain-containing protein [Bacteroidetes bacterium]|nr:T9SS type A sorting domain-containing protein [Bacteroidota bacterium]